MAVSTRRGSTLSPEVSMRTLAMLLCAAVTLGCQSDGPTDPVSNQSGCPSDNPRTPCTPRTSVRTEGRNIIVTVVRVLETKETYQHDGYVCVRTIFRCQERHCHF